MRIERRDEGVPPFFKMLNFQHSFMPSPKPNNESFKKMSDTMSHVSFCLHIIDPVTVNANYCASMPGSIHLIVIIV